MNVDSRRLDGLPGVTSDALRLGGSAPSSESPSGSTGSDAFGRGHHDASSQAPTRTTSSRSASAASGTARAGLLLSEVLDSGLLGEGVISTLRHAAVTLCKVGPGSCQAVPELAVMMGTPVECSALRRRSRLVLPPGCRSSRGALLPTSVTSYLSSCVPCVAEPYCCDRIDLMSHTALGPEVPLFALAMGTCR